jgi:hypothetical protein
VSTTVSAPLWSGTTTEMLRGAAFTLNPLSEQWPRDDLHCSPGQH